MAEVRCPNCGRSNPELLDTCQFCQTPLKSDPVLPFGQKPTKKNTGELEPILPDWLKDVRQQSRDSAEPGQAASKPAANEPLDLLAGLASQAGDSDEEIPDWLAGLQSAAKPDPAPPDSPEPPPQPNFFARFNQGEAKPFESTPEPVSPWQEDPAPASPERDELSDWFAQASGQTDPFVDSGSDAGNTGWGSAFVPETTEKPSAPEEDLSWLRNLEERAKQTGDLQSPRPSRDWTANQDAPAPQATGSQDDLSWLDSLGGIEEPSAAAGEGARSGREDLGWLDQLDSTQVAQPWEPEPEKPSQQEDLSWLNNLGSTGEVAPPAEPEKPGVAKPFATTDELNWMNTLAGKKDPGKPFMESAAPDSGQAPGSEDLSWLHNLEQSAAGGAQPAPAATTPEDLSWLEDIQGEADSLSAPPFLDTGALRAQPPQEAAPEEQPDWLKSAAEAPSMPSPGDLSQDWFAASPDDQPAQEAPVPSAQPAQPFADMFSTPAEPAAPLSNQDVDSLFSLEMPDWLSRPEPVTEEPQAQQTAAPALESEDPLAPVELPSWVQAMRPVEAVISPTTGAEDQPEEKEGPLAGLRGVIPGAPVGSAARPKPISLKLQASQEQQESAALLEQILGTETSPRALVRAPVIASQQVLRWALAAVFLLVLSASIILRSQSMPVSPGLSPEAAALSNAIGAIPAGARVLIVIDYEPSLVGEMEAMGAPLLDRLASSGRPNLSLISTSPNGPALAERLLSRARINITDGYAYLPGTEYLNLGFLPGGSASVLGFLERPGQIMPASQVSLFADYAAVIVMTDHAESGRIWVEQLQSQKQVDPLLSGQPLLMVASAQASPLLQPYVASGQVAGMISGLTDTARYEALNQRPAAAHAYWDSFGTGLALSVGLILAGSLWSLFTQLRARRAVAEQE